MKFHILFALLFSLSIPVYAHTGGEVEVTCPLDGKQFKAWQDFSGTSYDSRLDFKKEGPIAQPWALAQCPKCRLTITKPREKLSDAEITQLKTIVSSKEFRKQTRDATSYYAFGVLKEHLKEKPMDIAWAYLCASWQVENEPEKYKATVRRAIHWYDEVAKASAPDSESKTNVYAACWLGIELNRRISNFSDAEQRLSNFPKLTDGAPEWIETALVFQKDLLSKEDGASHNFSENPFKKDTNKTPKIKKRMPPGPDAPVEERVQWNLRSIMKAAEEYMLNNGVDEVKYSQLVGPEKGKLLEKIEPVSGEDYSKFTLKIDDREVSITLSNGKKISVPLD